jgi:uncharacterized protein
MPLVRVVALCVLGFFCLTFPAMAKIEVPSLTGRVVDLAGLLTAATEAEFASRLEAHERASTNQIVVVTLPSLQGRPIEEWGLTLGREWGIGQEGKDNGVVFLVAPNERELRIEVGYGLEGSLPDAIANSIIQHEVIPLFKQGDMAGGIRAGVEGIIAALGGTYQPSMAIATTDSGYSPLIDTLVPIAFFAVSVAVGLLMSLRRRWDNKRNRYVWYIARSTGGGSGSRSSSFGRSGGFSGGGGSFGGGGASGRW